MIDLTKVRFKSETAMLQYLIQNSIKSIAYNSETGIMTVTYNTCGEDRVETFEVGGGGIDPEIEDRVEALEGDVEDLQNAIEPLQTSVQTLTNDYDSQYHLCEIMELILAPSDFQNAEKKYTVRNEMFSLEDSLVEVTAGGGLTNNKIIADAELYAFEQTVDGQIDLGIVNALEGNIKIVLSVYLKGTATN